MPLHDLRKYALPASFNHIPMTRNHPVKVPLVDPLHTLGEPRPIARTSPVPDNPSLRQTLALRVLKPGPDLRDNTRFGIFASLAELLSRGHVEDEVSLDESAGGFVVENELLVEMRMDVFVFEFVVELEHVSYIGKLHFWGHVIPLG